MKKILLMTWFNNNNFGTLLQATAMQNILKSMGTDEEGYECNILNYIPSPKKAKKSIKYYFNPKKYYLKTMQIYSKFYARKYDNQIELQNSTFKKYINENLLISPKDVIKSEKDLAKINNDYDIYLCGSDQIWNPKSLDYNYLLGWVSDSKTKASYGSSLSSTPIPEYYYEMYNKYLNRFKHISIRDKKCKSQLEEITGRKIETVADPVILWGRDKLLDFAGDNFENIDDYCFAYILGPSIKLRNKFLQYCKQKNLKPISVVGVSKENLMYDKKIVEYADWETDPKKFVNYIKNSKFVITDSFHSVVVSVLLHKDFCVFEKDKNHKEQNNRILELLDTVGLMDRWRSCDEQVNETKISREKWTEVDEKIELLRKSSMEYLHKIFE